jgi:hypothetical protein
MITRLQYIAIRAAVLGVVAAGIPSFADAQKAKPSGPPVVTKGTLKSNPKADKGQATAEAARAEARDRKGEHTAIKAARQESKNAVKGLGLTDAERSAWNDVEKKYEVQYKDLEKSEKAGDKAGTDDPAFIAKVDALRAQERMELRALLTPEQQTQYDRNIAPKVAKKS